MNCQKCGTNVLNNERYCPNCGCLINQNTVPFNTNASNTVINQNVDIKINKDLNRGMKKYAIFSIVLSSIGIVCYLSIGFSLYLMLTFFFASQRLLNKQNVSDQKIFKVAKVLNYILLILGIVVFALLLINRL